MIGTDVRKWKMIAIALVVAIVANLFLVRAYVLRNQDQATQTPLLKTYKASGNCFYKKKSSSKWLFLSGEETLYSESALQTEADSHVILSFADADGKIEVSENTQLEIYKDPKNKTGEDTVLDFKKGEVFVNYQSTSMKDFLTVKVGEKYFKISNSDVYVYGDAKGQVAISVDYGKATMTVGDRTNTFENGQMVFFKTDRDYTVEESPFHISTPLNYDRYSVEDEIFKVRFAYGSFNKDYYVQLFLGATPFEVKPYFAMPQKMKNNEFVVALPKGSYYWKLAAYTAPKLAPAFYSHTKRFFIEPKIRIQPVFPLASAKYPLQSGIAHVQFEWDNPSQLEKAFIEISDEKNFSHILVHEATSENNFFLYDFDHAGEYYWRVSGFPFKSSELIGGVIRKIVISENNPKQFLKIIFPKDDISLTTSSLENSDIQFQWTKNPTKHHAHYKIEIQSMSAHKKYEFKTDDTYLKVTDLPQGTYKWHISDGDDSGAISESENFKIIKTARLNFQNAKEGELGWVKGPKGTATYHVDVLKIGSRSSLNEIFSRENKDKKTSDIKTEKFNVSKLAGGVYAFKVYALDKEKNILADSSLKFLKIPEKK